MFAPLIDAAAGSDLQPHPINLPGFGAPALRERKTSLHALAAYLMDCAKELGADTVLAHSVASIIASIAASELNSPLTSILSLKGNLTPEDAYFSGTAAQYASPVEFRGTFLNRLDELAQDDPIIERYRGVVESADPTALWELGFDAHAFSVQQSPGGLLQSVPNVAYLYNPQNLPDNSFLWLENNPLRRFELPGASHWASVDHPQRLAQRITEALKA